MWKVITSFLRKVFKTNQIIFSYICWPIAIQLQREKHIIGLLNEERVMYLKLARKQNSLADSCFPTRRDPNSRWELRAMKSRKCSLFCPNFLSLNLTHAWTAHRNIHRTARQACIHKHTHPHTQTCTVILAKFSPVFIHFHSIMNALHTVD